MWLNGHMSGAIFIACLLLLLLFSVVCITKELEETVATPVTTWGLCLELFVISQPSVGDKGLTKHDKGLHLQDPHPPESKPEVCLFSFKLLGIRLTSRNQSYWLQTGSLSEPHRGQGVSHPCTAWVRKPLCTSQCHTCPLTHLHHCREGVWEYPGLSKCTGHRPDWPAIQIKRLSICPWKTFLSLSYFRTRRSN